MSADLPFIEYGGRIVAVAGRTRCYFVDDLDPATLNFVAVMCLCKHEVDEGRLEGSFTSELAAKWARLIMIGPHNFAGTTSTDAELAERLHVPLHQVAIARREFASVDQVVGETVDAGHQRRESSPLRG